MNSPISPVNVSLLTTPQQNPSVNKESECRKLCSKRFTFVIFYSIAIQYVLLIIFLLCVNLSLIHPIQWFKASFSVLFSLTTWLWTIPLITSIVLYGIYNMKPYLREKTYYRSRISKFLHTFPHQSVILLLSLLIGVFTAFLYKKYLREEYRVFLLDDNKKALNGKSVFLVFNGLFMGLYYFFKMRNPDQLIQFPIVYQLKYHQLREQLYSALHTSIFQSFFPVINYILIYCLFSKVILYSISWILRINTPESSYWENLQEILDVRLLIYAWILSSQILTNMNLMTQITLILSTEPFEFPVDESNELTLTDALSVGKYQVTQQLAAMDLFLLAENSDPTRRKKFYTLSIPGGHPNNWKRLVNQCLEIIDKYSEDLSKSIENVSIKNNNTCRFNLNKPTLSSEVAEKLLIRQYNEKFGIRNMTFENQTDQAKPATPDDPKSNPLVDRIAKMKKKFVSLPIIFYFFGEPENGKLCFLLIQQLQVIIWVTQGLASIVAYSLEEDNYGVVQNDIKRILKSYLRLKTVLDKIVAINIGVKKIDCNYAALKCAVKRSLYKIVLKFSRYFDDLMLEHEDLRTLQNFVNFKEL